MGRNPANTPPDASKTPPSRFQKRKGSIYATPSSRDGHVDKHIDRDAVFHATHAEKGWGSVFGKGAAGGRRGSKGEGV
ncbi:C6 zinc finger domain containing protein [Rutstroemia sp. NJR-2017a BVV2]|nr:C6 zinc finger domain containing protein [Rutstroemia sp. NJR-2017a BVV2]